MCIRDSLIGAKCDRTRGPEQADAMLDPRTGNLCAESHICRSPGHPKAAIRPAPAAAGGSARSRARTHGTAEARPHADVARTVSRRVDVLEREHRADAQVGAALEATFTHVLLRILERAEHDVP